MIFNTHGAIKRWPEAHFEGLRPGHPGEEPRIILFSVKPNTAMLPFVNWEGALGGLLFHLRGQTSV